MKQIKVVKFGGSSLADANQFKKVASIVNADPDRRFVVASAPGKRFYYNTKPIVGQSFPRPPGSNPLLQKRAAGNII